MTTLEEELAARVRGEIRFDAGSRAAYSHDASNYRQPPIGVVVPYDVDAGAQAVRICHERGVPLLSRGGGTSLAGQCCNAAVVIDWSKYCRRLLSVDPERRIAVVEPGICLDDLNRLLEPHGLMVGPKPSTHNACTIGGMIGNNSCGASAQAYGKMADTVVRLEVLTPDGVRFWAGETSPEEYERIAGERGRRAEIYRALRKLCDDNLALIRTRYPDIPRRVSGYNLDALLPEKGFHVGRALVGSESTLVTVLHAEISLVPKPAFQSLVVLGYDDIAKAGDVVPAVAEHRPLALEGLDDVLIDLARSEHMASESTLAELPEGSGWLMVRFGGSSQEEVDERARRLMEDAQRMRYMPHTAFLHDPAEEERLWKVREAGLGATAYPPGGPDTHEGWEDAAVPPERLGGYLRDFRALIDEFGYGPVSLYGHFGQGCVHTRIPFDMSEEKGVHRYREFVERAAHLVSEYGGSLSGEHGDGQSRGELLPIMFGDEVVRLFRRMKKIFDPDGRMNPGKVVDPYPLDEHLDLLDYHPAEPRTHFDYPADRHSFAHAAARCVGIGKCRASEGGVMCPSYRVTHEERHTTRGRARLLQEMMRGEVIDDGWRSDDVRDALDLCLACKGCRQDCPVGVDMATYKAEFLSHHYAGRLRPLSHYSMGWLPLWAGLAAAAPRTINALAQAPVLNRIIKRAGGVDQRRDIPAFAAERFTGWFRTRPAPPRGDLTEARGAAGRVVLWPDTFTNNFHPHIAKAAVEVLERAGFTVDVPPQPSGIGVPGSGLCCGLPWISTGQLGVAARVLRRTARALAPRLREGIPVVVLEPSCAAAFRADAPELLTDDQDVALLRDRTRTIAELLDAHDALPVAGAVPAGLPRPAGSADRHAPATARNAPPGVPRGAEAAGAPGRVLAQPHCHQHAIMGFDTDRKILERAGVDVEVLDAGCCGLAGNFGFERGHYEVSTGAAELGLWPAVRDAEPGTVILADGFSCRTQIEAGTDAHPRHLAELLWALG